MTGSAETIPASQFWDQCLRLMDEVNAMGRELIVTKHGRPVVAVVPVARQGAPGVSRCNRSTVSTPIPLTSSSWLRPWSTGASWSPPTGRY